MSTFRLALVAAVFALAATQPAAAAPHPVLEHYLAVQAMLAADQSEGAAEHLSQIEAATADSDTLGPIAVAVSKIDATSITTLRAGFKALSIAIADAVSAGSLDGAGLYYCPMAKGYWLQATGDAAVRNPYYGASMLRCGGPAQSISDTARG